LSSRCALERNAEALARVCVPTLLTGGTGDVVAWPSAGWRLYTLAPTQLDTEMTTNGKETATVALVTGATRGIGVEIVRQLATAGQTVYLGARNIARGEEVGARLDGAGCGAVRVLALDVTDRASLAAAAERIEREAGRLDVLVNNAAVNTDLGPDGMIAPAHVTAEQLRATYETNVIGVAATINAMLPLLRRSAAARIINLSTSIASLTRMSEPGSRASQRRLLAYCTSKAAVNALTLTYANELRDAGIRVHAVDPGHVSTEMNGHAGTLTPAEGARVAVALASGTEDWPSGTFVGEDRDGGGTVPVPW
jgi:NAD(P)-dependent dehydrogenase (short-subunit alcohol dehydrogenase family)